MLDSKNPRAPSSETHTPREECAENSFRTDVFVKKSEKGVPEYVVRLIYCCPKGKWDSKLKRCMDSMTLHKIYREPLDIDTLRKEIRKDIRKSISEAIRR